MCFRDFLFRGHALTANSKAFDKLLLDAVDSALSSLGESAKQSIYYHLEVKFSITRSEIPRHLDEFQAALEKIFGLGGQFIQILIMKNLYAKIGQPLLLEKNRQLDFMDYIKAAKQSYLKRWHKHDNIE